MGAPHGSHYIMFSGFLRNLQSDAWYKKIKIWSWKGTGTAKNSSNFEKENRMLIPDKFLGKVTKKL